MPKVIIHLDSGGMDSTVLKYWLHGEGHKLHSVLFDYGQRHVQELEWAKHHCHRLGILFTTITLPKLRGSALTDGEAESMVVPARNAIFLTMAANLAEAAGSDTITIGCNSDDETNFPDCRMAFIQMFNHMLMTAEIKVQVWAPFLDKKKDWIAALGQEVGCPLHETWSCYMGGSKPCGKCEACAKREAALKGVS